MRDVIIRWTDPNLIENGHKIYKSNSPMDINNLPTPHDILPQNTSEYVDTNQAIGTTNYYIVSAFINDSERYSEQIEHLVEPPIITGPGPEDFIGGDASHGFFGEVSSTDFITGDALASAIGLTAGTSQHTDTPWLKYSLDDEIIFIPKKPIRYNLTWEHIYQAGAVYGSGDNGLYPSGSNRTQDAMVTIDGLDFKVTLLKGGNTDPTPNSSGYDIGWTHGSEWNKLLYPVHSGVHTDASNPSNPSEPYNRWASYSDADLLVRGLYGNGAASLTQERNLFSPEHRVYRSYSGVSYASRNTATTTNTNYGYRPALRLIR